MLHIYVARHGQNVDNASGILNGHRDFPLTGLGRKQATITGEFLRAQNLKFKAIYSSPLSRAHETAEIIARVSDNPDPEINTDLIERDFGDMAGKPVTSISTEYEGTLLKTAKVNYMLDPQNGETFPEALLRAETVLNDIRAKHTDGNVLLVCHMDISYMLVAAYYQLEWKHVLRNLFFGNSELLLLSPDHTLETALVHTAEQFNI